MREASLPMRKRRSFAEKGEPDMDKSPPEGDEDGGTDLMPLVVEPEAAAKFENDPKEAGCDGMRSNDDVDSPAWVFLNIFIKEYLVPSLLPLLGEFASELSAPVPAERGRRGLGGPLLGVGDLWRRGEPEG